MSQTKLDPNRPKIQHFLRPDGIGGPLKQLQDLLSAEWDLFIPGGAFRNRIAKHFRGRASRTYPGYLTSEWKRVHGAGP